MMVEVASSRRWMGALNRGDDLLPALTQIVTQERIQMGRLEALGAVERAVIGFYSQKRKQYLFQTLEHSMEITGLVGNISLKDGAPFIHAHITLCDEEGRFYGGHLAHGTTVFACEFVLEVFEGPRLERKQDDTRGLALW